VSDDADRLEGRQQLARAVRDCALRLAAGCSAAGIDQLVGHAEDVLAADPELHLTTIRESDEFVARHIGEALQGAALIDAAAEGPLLDLGSGNGYPGLAVCAARPGLRPLLAEVSQKKAAFLRTVVAEHYPGAEVLNTQVQRPTDLELAQPLRVLVTRAMGGWEKIIPRLVPCLAKDGEVLIWAGRDAEIALSRGAWRRLELTQRTPLVGRDRSWIWSLRPVR
jgi:16S rRNA G527 N7-methylase RsmG